jgi:ABC-type phosphate transport system auxiliary subunit
MSEYYIEFVLAAMASIGAVFAYLRSSKGSAFIKNIISVFTGEKTATEIHSALDSLAKVVSAQGESIEWLRNELELTKEQLMEAREALKIREDELQAENSKLKSRIAELETQVNALQDELNRRKKYTRKDYRSE